jgi:DNA-binding NarL/FixJ family response regulator
VSAKDTPESGRSRSTRANRGPRVAILGGVGTFVTEALTWMLMESGSRVMGAYPSVRALRAALSGDAAEVQVVVVDAEDHDSGTAVLPALRRGHPRLKVLLLCEAFTPAIARCALAGDVEGVVLKSDSVEEVILALHHILDGRAVMPAGWQAVSTEPEPEIDPIDSLSAREREVLELAAGGMRNSEIAERLMISTNTVKFHLRTVYARLGIRNRVQAMNAIAPSQEDEPGEESPPAESKI